MASSLPLHHPSHCLISNPQVPSLSHFISPFSFLIFCLINFDVYVNQLQGFNYGGLPRPRFSFTTKDTEKGIRIQPIKAKAATEASPFSLLQSPQAEDSPSEVIPISDSPLCSVWLLRKLKEM